jgi:hypothetical protein
LPKLFSENSLEIVEGEADLLSIHALETTTPMLREDATTLTTLCTNIEKYNLKTNQEKGIKLTSVPTSFSAVFESTKRNPWHLIKKRGSIPDGLVQTRL